MATRFVADRLFGVSATDLPTIDGAAIALLTVTELPDSFRRVELRG